MATLYVTSTNATGSGTLYNLIQNASPGDVITPDPEVFGVGERVEITLSAYLNFTCGGVTIDGGKTDFWITRGCCCRFPTRSLPPICCLRR